MTPPEARTERMLTALFPDLFTPPLPVLRPITTRPVRLNPDAWPKGALDFNDEGEA